MTLRTHVTSYENIQENYNHSDLLQSLKAPTSWKRCLISPVYTMCWNADISLNTFIFGCFALIFIFITNTYTKYKTPEFDHPIMYLFIFSVIIVQLIEYFLWKNLNNKKANRFYSQLLFWNVILQPFVIMLMIKDTFLRNLLAGIYGFITLMYALIHPYLKRSPAFYTTVGKNGHLVWEWSRLINNVYDLFVFGILLSYTVAILLIDSYIIRMIGLVCLFLSLLFYFKDGTFGSMWCWSSNIFMLYFVVNILLIQPFIEYNGLC